MKKLTKFLGVSLAILYIFGDLYSTHLALDAGAHEGNPIAALFIKNIVLSVVIKGIMLLFLYAGLAVRNRERLSNAVLASLDIVMVAVIINNLINAQIL